MNQRRNVHRRLPKTPTPFIGVLRQWLACVSAMVTMIIVGAINGWTMTIEIYQTTDQLQQITGQLHQTTDQHNQTTEDNNLPLKIRHKEYSWIVTVMVLASMIGSLLSAQLADISGRKYCLLLCSPTFAIGWLMIYAATSAPMLYAASVLLGLGIGIACTINPMYLSEVADINNRAALGALIAVFIHIGTMLICALKTTLPYKSALVVLIIMSLMSLLSNAYFPETPYYLAANGRKKQAYKLIAYYKHITDPDQVKLELRALRAETRYELHPESRYKLHEQSRSEFNLSSRTNFTAQSESSSPISVGHTDTKQEVDTEIISDLNLPSRNDSHLLTSSDSNLQSVVHSEVVCQVHQKSSPDSQELPLQPSRELQGPSTSEIQPEATSEIRPEATSEIRPEATSEIQPEATSEIHPKATSEIQPEATSKIQPEAKSEIQPEAKSEIHPKATSEIQPEATSEIQRPSTSEIHSKATSEIQPKATSEIHPKVTSEIQPEETSEIQPKATSEIQRLSASEIQPEATSEIQPEATSEIQPEATSEIQPEATIEIQPEATSEIQGPSTSEIQGPSTSEIQGPSTSEIQGPSTSKIRRSSTSEIKRSSTSEIKRSSTSEQQSEERSETHHRTRSNLRAGSNVESDGPPDMGEIYIGGLTTWLTKLQVILNRSNRKALFIMFGLIMSQHLSGNFITKHYLKVFFKEMINTDISTATFVVHSFSVLSALLACLVGVDHIGRRTHLIMSTLASSFIFIILASYLLFVQYKYEAFIFFIIYVMMLTMFQVMFQFGLGSLPNVLLCELFPSELRGFVSAIILIFDGMIGFIVSKLYEEITSNVGLYTIYFIFATSCCSAFLMVFIWLPETKGKTYDEIQELLDGKNLYSCEEEEERTYEMDILGI